MQHPAVFWIGFHLLIGILLIFDLVLLRRKQSVITWSKACLLSGFWIGIALLFNYFVYLDLGASAGLQFFTGYLIEKSLSVDNLVLFLVIFTEFKVPIAQQHRVLFWGILGVIFFRITLIVLGIALIQSFHWMFYVFGLFLLFSGIKFFMQEKTEKQMVHSRLLAWMKKCLPIASSERGFHFFVREKGRWKAGQLLLVLGLIEITDVIFALDSIPAVFAVTTDPFIVYTSNVLAILGLRSLYFVLAPALRTLRYLRPGLALILIFVGAKMLLADQVSISVPHSLAVIAGILAITVLCSLQAARR